MVHFGEFLKTWSLRSNSVTRQVNFNRTKIGGKCQKFKCDILSNFQTMWDGVYKKSWLLSCCMLLKSQWGLRTLMMMSLRRILGFLSTHIFKGWLLDRAILSDAGFMELSSMYSYQIQASVWGSISLTNPDPRKDLSLSFFIWKCICPTAFLGIRAS